jgi:organic hydroperoxide reductase OsmC/OhrA
MADTFEVHLNRIDGYQFRADFGAGGIPSLVVDEPPPLGGNAGPNPARLLATAVADCLSASLIFCLAKSRVEVAGVDTRVVGSLRRNERGRLRIGRLEVSIRIDVPGADPARLGKCLEGFEDYCVVTASVRKGIEVDVTVVDAEGREIFASPAVPTR